MIDHPGASVAAALSEAELQVPAERYGLGAPSIAAHLTAAPDPDQPEARLLAAWVRVAQGGSLTPVDLQSPIDQLIARPDLLGAAHALWTSATLLAVHGPPALAAAQLDQAARIGAALDQSWFTPTHAYYQAFVAYHRGDLAAAGAACAAGRRVLHPTLRALGRRIEHLDALIRAESGAAGPLLAPLPGLPPDPDPRAAHFWYRAAIRRCLDRRERGEAARLLAVAANLPATAGEHLLLDLDQAALALRSRGLYRALTILADVRARALALHLPGVAARAALLEAEAWLGLGKKLAAERALAAGLVLLEPERRPFLLPLRPWLPHLLTGYRSFRRLPVALADLLVELADPDEGPSSPGDPPARPSEVPRLLLQDMPTPRLVLDGHVLSRSILPLHAERVLLAAMRAGGALTHAEIRALLPPAPPRGAHILWNINRDLRRILGPDAWRRAGAGYTLGISFRPLVEQPAGPRAEARPDSTTLVP